MKAKEVVVVNVRIPLTLKMAVKKYVERDTHIDFSDFMRDSMREKLKKDALWILKEALMTEPSARGRITSKDVDGN